MKIITLLALFVASLACCQGNVVNVQGRSISDILYNVIEELKVQMPNGFPQYGIPPLAPFKHAHIDIGSDESVVKATLDDLEVNGLNEFDIVILQTNVLLSRINYEFNFANLNLSTTYKAAINSGVQLEREGGAFMALKDLKVAGAIKYSTGIVGSNNNLRIKEINVNISVGKVESNIENLSKYGIMNRKLNEIVEEFINITINENTELVAEWIDGTLTPMCNDLIGDRTVQDILDLITGGGSN